jgi:PD-(D/E)XK endonuclease
VLTTDQKGAIAETAIAHAAAKLGIDVYKPISEGGRYDLIFDVTGRLLRVQCKWATRYGDVIAVRTYSSRRSGKGFLKRAYTGDEVDLIAVYCHDVQRCYLLQLDHFDGRTQFDLRLAPSRNNQRVGVNWASDFELEARLERLLGP